MKKSIILLALSLFTTLSLFVPQAYALNETDGSNTQAPRSSGFVDDKGNPISIEDYNKQRAQESKGAIARYPAAFGAAGIIIVGGAGFIIFRKVKKQ